MSGKQYEIAGFKFNNALSNNETFVDQQGYNFIRRFLFKRKVKKLYQETERKIEEAIQKGACYYGPFKGEFGHALAHTTPFLMYLYNRGVKIHYCGMDIHLPILKDEKGESIIHRVLPLRDFFAEVSPKSNATIPPEDVLVEIDKFYAEAKSSGLPLFDIGDQFYYWFVHRELVENYGELPKIDAGVEKENSCVVFPRSKGAKQSHNNGAAWDYSKLVDILSKHYDTVYVCGHPSQVLEIEQRKGVEMRVSADNSVMLDACKRSKAIYSQHSGVFYLPCFMNIEFNLLYKGGKSYQDIGSFQNSVRFVNSLDPEYLKNRLSFIFDYPDLEAKLNSLENQNTLQEQ